MKENWYKILPHTVLELKAIVYVTYSKLQAKEEIAFWNTPVKRSYILNVRYYPHQINLS